MRLFGSYKEENILAKVKQGDGKAMRTLYDRNIEYMSAVCARYIADVETRKDILQDAFIKIISSIGSFHYRGEGSLKAWMLRITANEALNYLRQAASKQLVEYDDKLPDVAEEPEVEGLSPDVLRHLILRLPPGYRMVLNLYVFENKSHKEIAQLLGIGESSSASQFLRAKALLAKFINEYKKSHLND